MNAQPNFRHLLTQQRQPGRKEMEVFVGGGKVGRARPLILFWSYLTCSLSLSFSFQILRLSENSFSSSLFNSNSNGSSSSNCCCCCRLYECSKEKKEGSPILQYGFSLSFSPYPFFLLLLPFLLLLLLFLFLLVLVLEALRRSLANGSTTTSHLFGLSLSLFLLPSQLFTLFHCAPHGGEEALLQRRVARSAVPFSP